MNASDVRSLFPILKQRTYLFSGGHSPMSSMAQDALKHLTGELSGDPAELYGRLNDQVDIARGLFAGLIGADEDEIAVLDSTGAGSNLAVELIEPRIGGNVVFDEWSYPSSIFPWMLPPRDVVERRFVKSQDGIVELESIADAINDDTIAVSISHITQGEGFRQDLSGVSQLAHAHGALLLVDAAQSAGAVNIDVHQQGVDFLSAGACKWLLGAAGIGFFYAARHLMDRMPPHAAGPSSVREDGFSIERDAFIPTLKPGADRFQLGTPNLLGLAATVPGLEILTEVGIDTVEQHVKDLSGYCIQGLNDRGFNVLTPDNPRKRGGVVAVVMDQAPEVEQFMRERNIDVYSGHTHNKTLRIDPHIFNNREDIDKFLVNLDAYQ